MYGLNLYSNAYFLNLKDNEHGLGSSMTFTGATFDEKGGAMGPSVEQAVADFQYAQAKTKFRALTLGVNANEVYGHTATFYCAAKTPLTPQSSAQATFDMLFNGADIPAAGPMSPPPVTKDPARRSGACLRVNVDATSLAASTMLSERPGSAGKRS